MSYIKQLKYTLNGFFKSTVPGTEHKALFLNVSLTSISNKTELNHKVDF